jgi:Kef-type K+ transport system membrane component KefB
VASIAFPFGLGAIVSLWLKDINNENNGPDWKTPHDTAFILFMGVSLSFTAFPVLCSLLKSKGITRTPLGMMVCVFGGEDVVVDDVLQAISCAAIDDIMAWCMLAIASSFSKSGSAADGTLGVVYYFATIELSLSICFIPLYSHH